MCNKNKSKEQRAATLKAQQRRAAKRGLHVALARARSAAGGPAMAGVRSSDKKHVLPLTVNKTT